MKSVLAFFAATLFMASPTIAKPVQFEVKNCDSVWLRVCAYNADDKALEHPAMLGDVKIKSGERETVACLKAGAEKCQVFWRKKGDTCGKPTKKKMKRFSDRGSYYVWIENGKRKSSTKKPDNCGKL